MLSTHHKNPLSSVVAFVQGLNSATPVAANSVHNPGWRSEAFAEDLPPELPPTAAHEQPGTGLQAALQCVLPLAVALAGGVMAYLSIGA